MPKRSSKRKDFNEIAFEVVQKATGQAPAEPSEDAPPLDPITAAAKALGSLGGKKGGPARAMKLTPERRREIAQGAARKRWKGTSERTKSNGSP